jgi:hypothetical protein
MARSARPVDDGRDIWIPTNTKNKWNRRISRVSKPILFDKPGCCARATAHCASILGNRYFEVSSRKFVARREKKDLSSTCQIITKSGRSWQAKSWQGAILRVSWALNRAWRKVSQTFWKVSSNQLLSLWLCCCITTADIRLHWWSKLLDIVNKLSLS